MVEVIVQDQGRGIEKEHLENVFKPFSRPDIQRNTVYRKEGNGIGLSICKAICKNLSGCISVSSELGHGAQFTF